MRKSGLHLAGLARPDEAKCLGDQVPHGAVWLLFVLIKSPSFDFALRVGTRQKPIFVEALSPDAFTEGLNECIVRWIFGPIEVECQPVGLRPMIRNS